MDIKRTSDQKKVGPRSLLKLDFENIFFSIFLILPNPTISEIIAIFLLNL